MEIEFKQIEIQNFSNQIAFFGCKLYKIGMPSFSQVSFSQLENIHKFDLLIFNTP